jgi:hypothetical protein
MLLYFFNSFLQKNVCACISIATEHEWFDTAGESQKGPVLVSLGLLVVVVG